VRHLQASASTAIHEGEENRDAIVSGFPRSEINFGFGRIDLDAKFLRLMNQFHPYELGTQTVYRAGDNRIL